MLIFAAFLTENVLDDDGESAKDWLIFLSIDDCASRLAVTRVLFAK